MKFINISLLSLLLLLTWSCDDTITVDCLNSNYTFDVNVNYSLEGEFIRLGDSIIVDINYPRTLKDFDTERFHNIDNVFLNHILRIESNHDNPNLDRFSSTVGSADSIEIRVEEGMLRNSYDYPNRITVYRPSLHRIFIPKQMDTEYRLRIILKPKAVGIYDLSWTEDSERGFIFSTIDLVEENGCDQFLSIQHKNTGITNLDLFDYRPNFFTINNTEDNAVDCSAFFVFQVIE